MDVKCAECAAPAGVSPGSVSLDSAKNACIVKNSAVQCRETEYTVTTKAADGAEITKCLPCPDGCLNSKCSFVAEGLPPTCNSCKSGFVQKKSDVDARVNLCILACNDKSFYLPSGTSGAC